MQTTTCTMTQVEEKHLNIVFMGMPGSGKGTQAAKLADKYSLVHISSGDLLRKEMEEDTPFGKEIRRHMEEGILFPDELVNSVLLGKVPSCDYILDGYPRKLSQVEVIKSVNLVLYLALSEKETVARVLNRNEDREDDTEDAIMVRIAAFKKKTQPVIDYYKERGILHEVDGSGTPGEVFERVQKVIQNFL